MKKMVATNIPPRSEKKSEKNLMILDEKVNLFKEFSINLINKINKTFPGSYGINNDDILNHYNWCYDTMCKTIINANVYLNNNNEVRDFFLDLMIKDYYSVDDKHKDIATTEIVNSISLLFSMNQSDSKSLNALNNIFKMFNKSIKK